MRTWQVSHTGDFESKSNLSRHEGLGLSRKCTFMRATRKSLVSLTLVCAALLWIVWASNGLQTDAAIKLLMTRPRQDFDSTDLKDSVGHLTATAVVVKDLDSMVSNLSSRDTTTIDFFEFASIASASPLKTRDSETFGYLGFSDRQKVYRNISLSRGRIEENSFTMQLFDFSSGGSPYWKLSPIVVGGVPGCFKYPDMYQVTNSTFVKMTQQCLCCLQDDIARGTSNEYHDVIIPVVHTWSYGFYHFVVEALPRLLLGLPHIQQTYKNYTILVDRGGFVKEYLDILEISHYQTISSDQTYCAKDMVILPPSACGVGIVEGILYLRHAMKDKVLGRNSTSLSRNMPILVIDRSKSGSRMLGNQEELLQKLEKTFPQEAFQAVQLETLSVREQITLFADAKGVIAPHGSGLSNIIFLPQSALVIELFPRHYVVKCYMNLAKLLNLPYRGLILQGDYHKASRMDADIPEIILILRQSIQQH